MTTYREAVDDFLAQKRIAVAGVSRSGNQPANAIFRKLRGAGYEVYAINPGADRVEGGPSYESLMAVPVPLDAVVAATPEAGTDDVVRQCVDLGIRRVWMHRGIGPGSVSEKAVGEAGRNGLTVLAGGCPLMFLEPDPFHRCLGWMLRVSGKLPAPDVRGRTAAGS
ncbi:MAG: CoA-binding protein [Acidobacteriota bacterium]|jgi:predicted CoA-binding protein